MSTAVPAHSLTAITLLQAHPLNILLVAYFPLHLFNFKHVLSLPQQDINIEGYLAISLVQVDVVHAGQALAGRRAPLIIVGLDIVDHLLFCLAHQALLFAITQ